ncbi:unnamed protein product [Malus baccata var. baccata]
MTENELYKNVYLPSKCLYLMDLGDLYDLLSGKGFSARQKRSAASNNVDVSSYSRYFAHFHRIPALESESSD